jgi:hypothetical protein
MAEAADLTKYNIKLHTQVSKAWQEEPFLFTYLDSDGVEHNEDLTGYSAWNMYFKASGQPDAAIVLTFTLGAGLAFQSPNSVSVAATGLQNFQEGLEGNYDFFLYGVDGSGNELPFLKGVVSVEPVVGD